jgi:hypothetical protein
VEEDMEEDDDYDGEEEDVDDVDSGGNDNNNNNTRNAHDNHDNDDEHKDDSDDGEQEIEREAEAVGMLREQARVVNNRKRNSNVGMPNQGRKRVATRWNGK